MKLNITAAEQLLNERLDITNMDHSTIADECYLRGMLAMLRQLGLQPEMRDGHYKLFGGDQNE